MGNIKNLSPVIRFKNFTNDWEQRKFGEFLKEFNIKSKEENEYTVLSSTNSGMEVRDGRVSAASNVGYKIIEDGDLVLSPQNLWLGNINVNDIGKGLVSPSYRTFKFVDLDKHFIEPQLRIPRMLEEYKNSSTQGASVVRRNLEMESFYQIPIRVPNCKEQKIIGFFFKNIDNLITLHQRKLENLELTKKTLLKKMFPKNNNIKPDYRFSGFTNSWEQRAFSDLVIRVSKSSNEDEFPRIEYEDIVSGLGQLNKDVFLKESDKKGNEFEVGDTLYGYLRPYLQNWILADFKGIAVGDWWVLRPNEMDSKFIYTLVQSNNYQVSANLSTGTKMPRSDWKVVSKTMFAVPTDKFEQNKIGELFSKLDHLITLHHRKLEKLELMKKYLLKNMFI